MAADRIAVRDRMQARSSMFSTLRSFSYPTVEILSSCSLFAVATPSLGILRIESSSKILIFPSERELDTHVELVEVSPLTFTIFPFIFLL